ncbi:NETI motif-containing protein [Gottfriedia acidiceleris]|uniref:NETI motif-containing protein n=1 Tax=Gottfriedia acidiceleris TaxID=371036 RepID=UPI000B446734|nr:NETI motif-containing protein [Gottfriedia acidiceleris]
MSKKKFEVFENETINECLERMQKEGYTPVKRMEVPIFSEQMINGKVEIEPTGRKIVFEGKLNRN